MAVQVEILIEQSEIDPTFPVELTAVRRTSMNRKQRWLSRVG